MEQEEAVAHARNVIGIGGSVAAQAHRVRRLDRKDESYYLVIFGEPQATVAVAAVNAKSGEVENWGRSQGLRAHLAIGAAEALRLARLPESASVELVWKPSLASRSPLYPVWEVRADGETRYVNQQGNVE